MHIDTSLALKKMKKVTKAAKRLAKQFAKLEKASVNFSKVAKLKMGIEVDK